jgi:hypothetical protein
MIMEPTRTLRSPAKGEQSLAGGTAPAQPPAAWDEDTLFLCPDRDQVGFVPSLR